ncbi:ABC transporter substrate-binding protein [Roseococcus sp. DSY-14]|uniref:ABC transporter substrate-binding protein n=1 Tax=Roseococcus sp. DSY-14 TaxID=3369650 RepID=UPI00387B6760
MTLFVATSRTPPDPRWQDAGLANVTRAFAPMVRDGRYDASEMAIATFLMAKAAGRALVLLPVVFSARAQEGALLVRADSPVRAPEDLRGARIGVRAYSQTTGMWLRGTLAEAHGLPPEAMRWITFEDAHLDGYQDPPWAERAPPGSDIAALLRDGALDAAIFGSEVPPGFRTVFPDPAAAGRAFVARHGFTPVNHLLVARAEVARERPDALRAFTAALLQAGCAFAPRAALDPVLALAGRLCHAQGLTPRALSPDDAWAGTPAALLHDPRNPPP